MDRDDLALIHRYLNGDLEGADLRSFQDQVAASEEMRTALARMSSDEVLLSEVLSEQRAGRELDRSTPASEALPGRKRRPSSSRRWLGRSTASPWPWAVAAAAVLVGLAVLAALPRAESRRPRPAPPRVDEARVEAAVEERSRAERSRLEAERELAEIARHRKKLEDEAPKPGVAEPQREERRQEELGRARRIEAELQEFVRKLREGRPVVEVPGAVPETPPERPADPTEPKPRFEPVTEAAVALVTRVEGEAFLPAGGSRTPVRAGQDLLEGQGLDVPAKGLVEVTFRDRTRLEIRSETEIRELSAVPARGKRLFVAKGTVWADVNKQPPAQPMIFQTPHGEAKVVGTTLRLVVEAGATRLDVSEGKVLLTRKPDGKTVEVASGHFAVAATGVDPAPRPMPVDDVLLLPRQAQYVRANHGSWHVERDRGASTGFVWQGSALGSRPDLKNCSHLSFSFRADADKEYHVWIRGRTTGVKDPLTSDHLLLVVPESVVVPSPPGGASLGAHADYNGFSEHPGYWWGGGNDYPAPVDLPVRVRFSRSGLQTLKLYAWEGPMRVDAIWLTVTQKSRPDGAQHGPSKTGIK